ncbi:OmpA family protein [Roseomonas sp. OT10]|uniref:flagellar motor protein MotB n=1 Tax=Roseomonas cutis TaxID=2897332 RepID=UPI001E650DCF|nr:flagellar motor protein MotB [Roseomonas sp. OT10]UFN48363.1 OmpA family protein [Roseomonas sp. OT10]
MAKGNRNGEGATIVIRREEGGGDGHHGGAWKVAYADFVTAMMAFFLLMWLLNATTEEQRHGLADYFAPTNVMARGSSGSGQPFGGSTPNDAGQLASTTGAVRLEMGPAPILQDIETEDESEVPARLLPMRDAPPGESDGPEARPGRVEMATPGIRRGDILRDGHLDAVPPSPDALASPATQQAGPAQRRREEAREADLAAASEGALRQELERRERDALEQLAEQLRSAVKADPVLAELAQQFRVEQVPEGLRIQLLDADRQPMFALGGSAPNERSRALIAKVAAIIQRVPNAVAITGHTDAKPFRTGERSNWDLAADRANVTRRLLIEGGLTESRLRSVAGLAEREPLLPEDPQAAANRRVAILLLRQNPAPGTQAR